MTRGAGPPPTELARIIEAARRGAPQPPDALRESVHARVAATVGGAGGAGAAGSSTAGGAGSGAITGTLVKGGLVALLALGGGWALLRAGERATPLQTPTLAAPSSAADEAPRELRVAVEPRPAPPAEREPVAAPRRAQPEDSLALEEALLERARRDIDADPPAALRELDEHAARFPNGQLAEERDLLRVRAHRVAGDDVAARDAAGAFLKTYPHSIHRAEVESVRNDP